VKRYSLSHLSNDALGRALATAAANEKEATAELLAHIAEFDERKLYVPAAYPSMLAYCMGELRLPEEAAKKRIRVARAGHSCPGVFEALASGRVHLSGLVVLSTYLSPENASELLAAATHKSREEIDCFLAGRFPKLEMPGQVTPIPADSPVDDADQRSPGTVDPHDPSAPLAGEGAPAQPRGPARVTPLSAEAYAVQFTRGREQDERFRYLQDLLGHQASRGDIAEVYDRAVKELVARMERVRFGASSKPRSGRRRQGSDSRHVPAEIKRAVWKRDGGQCTFESESGHRCEARGDVEFDHVTEVARGGEATIDNLRLRCRVHNQFTAEQTFGAGFMQGKRAAAAEARAAAKAAKAKAREEKEAESRLLPHEEEVVPWLRPLGFRDDESRIAVRRCRDMADAPLQARVKRALTYFGERIGRKVVPTTAATVPATSTALADAGEVSAANRTASP
jgi:5-methylcytosine-specific restriction endonuclease McrA